MYFQRPQQISTCSAGHHATDAAVEGCRPEFIFIFNLQQTRCFSVRSGFADRLWQSTQCGRSSYLCLAAAFLLASGHVGGTLDTVCLLLAIGQHLG